MSRKQILRQFMLDVHFLQAVQILAIGVPTYESGVHGIRMVQHELLDGCASTRTGGSKLMEPLEEGEPVDGAVGGGDFRSAVVDEPLGKTLECTRSIISDRKSINPNARR